MPDLDTTRFSVAVDAALREAGWQPGRWDMEQAERWADALRAHVSRPATGTASSRRRWRCGRSSGTADHAPGQGRQIAPSPLLLDPLAGLHLARSLSDLGRALETELAPLGAEGDGRSVLAVDVEGRVYGLDHAGDWYLGPDIDHALTALVTGTQPVRLANP